MKNRYRWIVLCFVLFYPIAVFAAGSSETNLEKVPVDLDLSEITEDIVYEDRDLMVFVLHVQGHTELTGVGEIFYSSYVTTEPSPPHKSCEEGELGGVGMGISMISIPGRGILMLEVESLEQCVNPATGEFRVTQKERVIGGTGELSRASGNFLLDVEGQMGSGQKIHMTGELGLP